MIAVELISEYILVPKIPAILSVYCRSSQEAKWSTATNAVANIFHNVN